MDKPHAIIELSNSAIKLVVGVIANGEPLIVYQTTRPLEGEILQGTIVNKDALIAKLHALTTIHDKDIKVNLSISEVTLVVPPLGLAIYHNDKISYVISSVIESVDVNNVLQLVRKEIIPQNHRIVDIIPDAFILDDNKVFFKPPIGQKSNSLQIIAKIHVLPTSVIDDYRDVIKKAGIRVRRLIVAPYSASLLINHCLKDIPTYILIDIGEEITTMSLIGERSLYETTYFIKGAKDLVKYVADRYKIPYDKASAFIKSYGLKKRVGAKFNPTIIKGFNNEDEIDIHPTDISMAIQEFLVEFIDALNKNLDNLLKDYQNTNLKKSPLIFIGGLTNLIGIKEFLESHLSFSEHIEIFVPPIIGGRNSALTNTIGAIMNLASFKGTLGDQEARVSKIERTKRHR